MSAMPSEGSPSGSQIPDAAPAASRRRTILGLGGAVAAYALWWVIDDLLFVTPIVATVHAVGHGVAWFAWMVLYIGAGYGLCALVRRAVDRRDARRERVDRRLAGDPVAGWCLRAGMTAGWIVGTLALGPAVNLALISRRRPITHWRRQALAASVLYGAVFVTLYAGIAARITGR